MVFVGLFGLASCYGDGPLRAFSTDGCSAFPDGTFEQQNLWLDCCTKHDFDYWKGGTRAERARADEQLQVCVAQAGEPEIAEIMLAGVRVGGSPYWPTKFRWAYGWPYGRGYRALSTEELAEIERQTGRRDTGR
jgi:hypothetical protein